MRSNYFQYTPLRTIAPSSNLEDGAEQQDIEQRGSVEKRYNEHDDDQDLSEADTLPLYASPPRSSGDESRDYDAALTIGSPQPVALEVPGFVPAWEGLRGVAVCMTCVSHIHVSSNFLSDVAGRGGVAIFFVLSGFLITGVLVKQQSSRQREGERFHYRHIGRFYMDRNVRLYPALLTLLLVTGVLQIAFNAWTAPEGLHWEALRVMFYVSNIEYGPSWSSLWGNTWSLGVEEQFYIIWSLLLPLLLFLRPGLRRSAIAMLMCSSFAFSYLQSTGTFLLPNLLQGINSPFSNFWKMYFGAMLRLSPNLPRWFMHRATGWCGLAGAMLLCVWATLPTPPDLSLLGLSEKYLGANVWHEPLMTVFAACAVLGTSKSGNALLETEAMRFLGRISYSMYLYQIPLLKLAGWPRGFLGLGLTSLGVIFATISTLYIEEPIRDRYRKWRHSSSEAGGAGHI